jgi:hypothetical protein
VAIALDAHTAGGLTTNVAGGSSPQTFFHTVGSGSDRLLVVEIQMRGGSGGVVTGVSSNVDGAFQAVSTEALSGSAHTVIYYLVNPTVGSHTISVAHTMTGTTRMLGSATSLTGVHQTTPLNASNKAAASSAGPMTVSLTTTVANCWVIDSCAMRIASNDTATMTAVTNRVSRTNDTVDSNGLRGLVSTIGPAAAAGSHTCEWTKTFNHDWAIMAAAFAPAAAAGAISGSTSPAFTTSGALAGSGALSGTAAPAFTPTGSLTGSGALSGSAAPAFSTSGALSATGSLLGSTAIVLTTTATLVGSGALAGESSAAFAPAGVLTGSGILAGTCSVAFSLDGTLDSPALPGDLSGNATVAFSSAGSLVGTGALAGSSDVAFLTAGALGGEGLLSGSSAIAFDTSGIMSGAGLLSASADVVFSVAGNISEFSGETSGSTSFAFTLSGTLTRPPMPGGRTTYASPLTSTAADPMQTTYASPEPIRTAA